MKIIDNPQNRKIAKIQFLLTSMTNKSELRKTSEGFHTTESHLGDHARYCTAT